jgi:hypothetical protein
LQENAYATNEQSISIPLQLRNRRPSSNADNFSAIPTGGDSGRMHNLSVSFPKPQQLNSQFKSKLDVDNYEVYDGTQPGVELHLGEKSGMVRSPSVGPLPSASKRQLRLRSSSEVRKNLYEEK